MRWNLDLNEGIDLSIFLFGTSEKKIFNLKKLLKESSSPIIIDIGANIGSTSLIMAKMFNDYTNENGMPDLLLVTDMLNLPVFESFAIVCEKESSPFSSISPEPIIAPE